jgi:hypothetical protein
MSNRQPSRGSKVWEGNISTNYLADFRLLSVEILLLDAVSASDCSLKCNVARVSRAKLVRPLSQNEIREIVMDSHSDEGEYCASDAQEEEEPRPPTRRSSSSKPPSSPDFSASSSEYEDNVGNVAGQQPQPCQWALSPNPRTRVVHNFTVAPSGKSIAAAHITRSTQRLAAVLRGNYYFPGCEDESLLPPVLIQF